MGWRVRDVAFIQQTTAVTTHPVRLPQGIQPNDIMLVIVGTAGADNTQNTFTSGAGITFSGSGWTPITMPTNGFYAAWKRAVGTETYDSLTVTTSATRRSVIQAAVISGVPTTYSPVVNTTLRTIGATSATSVTLNALTVTGTRNVVFYSFIVQRTAATPTLSVSDAALVRYVPSNASISAGPTAAFFHKEITAAGSTGNVTFTSSAAAGLMALGIAFQHHEVNYGYIGYYIPAHLPNTAVVQSINGYFPPPPASGGSSTTPNMHFNALRASAQHLWAVGMGGRFYRAALSTNTSIETLNTAQRRDPYLHLGTYTLSPTNQPDQRVLANRPIRVWSIGAANTRNYEERLTTVSTPESAVPVTSAALYAFAILNVPIPGQNFSFSPFYNYVRSTDTNYNLYAYTINSRLYDRVWQNTTPPQSLPNPANVTAATGTNLALSNSNTSSMAIGTWVWGEVNVKPITPGSEAGMVMEPAAGATFPITTTLQFRATFRDLNGRYGNTSQRGVDRGDRLTNYRIQVREASASEPLFDQEYTATQTEKNADLVDRTATGIPLINGFNHQWRIALRDQFEYSDWSEWITFTVASYGTIAPTSPSPFSANTTQTTLRPNFSGTWTHPTGAQLWSIYVQLSTTSDFSADVYESNEFSFVNFVEPNTTFTIPWDDLVWKRPLTVFTENLLPELASNTIYYYRFLGRDSTDLWMIDWSASRNFKTNAAPSLATGLQTAGNATPGPQTAYPLLSFTGTDSDNGPGEGMVGRLMIIRPNGTSVTLNAVYSAGTGRWSVQTTASHLQTYGVYTWQAYFFDGELYSGQTTSESSAQVAIQTFRYTANGVLTGVTPVPYVNAPTLTGRRPPFQVNWSSLAGRNLTGLTIRVYADNSGVRNPTPLFSFTPAITLASGTTSTFADSVFTATASYWLIGGRYYWWDATGTDQDGLTATFAPIRFKVNTPPSLPTGISLAETTPGTALGTVYWTRPTLIVQAVPDADGAAGTAGVELRVTRPDASTFNATLPYSLANQRWQGELSSAALTSYGTYTVQVTGTDTVGSTVWYTHDPENAAFATALPTASQATYSAALSFTYTALGTITNFSPVTFTSGNQTGFQPTFSGTWNSAAGHAMTAIQVEIALSDTFAAPVHAATYTLPSSVGNGNVFSATWSNLKFTGSLSANTTYVYRMRGIDALGINGSWIATQSIKTNAGPQVPVPVGPTGVVTDLPILEATIQDSDTAAGAVTAIFRIQQPNGTIVSNLNHTSVIEASRTYRFQTGTAQVSAYGEYRWAATAFDGQVYTNNQLLLKDAQYSNELTFRYTVAGTLTATTPPYPVAGVSVAPGNPAFAATWTSAANRNLRAVTLEIYDSSGVSLQATRTRTTYDTVTGNTISFGWSGDDLAPGTYQYRMQGADQDGVVSAWTAKTSFNVNRAPLAPVLPTTSAVTVTNPAFASDLSSWSAGSLAGVTVGPLVRDTSVFRTASGALRLDITANTTNADNAIPVTNTAAIAVTPNREYVLRAGVRVNPNTLRPRLFVRWYAGDGNLIATSIDPTRTTNTPNLWGTTWYEEAYLVTAPATAATCQIGVEAYWNANQVTGSLWIDDVSFTLRPATPAGVVSIANNDLATADSTTNWVLFTRSGITDAISWDSTVYLAASGALKWVRSASNAVAANFASLAAANNVPIVYPNTMIPVLAGRSYVIRIALRTSDARLEPVVGARWHDGSGAFSSVVFDTPDAWTANQWVERTFVVTAPAGMPRLFIGVYMRPLVDNLTGTIWIDDLSVTESLAMPAPAVTATFQDQDGTFLSNYGDYVGSGIVELFLSEDGRDAPVATAIVGADQVARASDTFTYLVPEALLGYNHDYRVRLRLTDSQGAQSPVVTTQFRYTPATLKNLTRSIKGNAVVGEAQIREMTATSAPVLGSFRSQVQITRADARIQSSTRVSWQLDATAVILPRTDLLADAVVVRPGETGRLIKRPGSNNWTTLTGWYVSDAERTDGTTFVGANFTTPYQFTTSATYVPQAIVLGFDSLVPVGVGTLTVRLQRYQPDGWQTLLTTTVTTAQLRQANKYTEHGQTATWLALALTTPVILEPGDVCAIAIDQQGVGANFLVTPGTTGKDGMTGNVLNCLLATDLHPSVIDNRPWLLPNWLVNGVQQRTELYLTSAPAFAIDRLITSVDCPLQFHPTTSIALRIGTVAIINGGLVMIAATGFTHELQFESGAGLILNSVITMTGPARTRYAKLADIANAETLTLDRTPTGWAVGDELHIQDAVLAQRKIRRRIASVVNNVVTLTAPIGFANVAGAYVVNLTRNVGLRALNQDANLALFDNAALVWTHAALIDFAGNPIVNPGPETLIVWNNVVIETGANSYAALELDPQHGVSELTIIADELTSIVSGYVAEEAMRLNGNWSHQGELLLIDSGTIAVNQTLDIDLIVIDPHYPAPRAAISMESDTTLRARITATGMPANATLITCDEANTQQIVLTNSVFEFLPGNVRYGIVTVAAASSLYELTINASRSNHPWLYLETGASVANATLNGSVTTASSLITANQPALVSLRDPMNPQSLPAVATTTGTPAGSEGLAAVSRVSTQYVLQTQGGYTAIDSNIGGSSGNARYIESAGGNFRAFITQHPLLAGEQLRLRVSVLGSGTLTLAMESSVPNLPGTSRILNFTTIGSWSTIEIDMIANQNGVANLTVTTSTRCWVDQIQRIS